VGWNQEYNHWVWVGIRGVHGVHQFSANSLLDVCVISIRIAHFTSWIYFFSQ